MASAVREPPFPHLDDLRRAYDADASHRNGIEDLQWRGRVLEAWLPELPSSPRLLELGPGTGQLASLAQSLGARVHAIDLSAQNVSYCRQRGISAEVGDFRALGRIDGLGTFDGVYAINALLHVPRAEHASVIAAARHCLVPGGSLLLVNWGGRDTEGIWAHDTCDPPRFFSQYDDASFFALAFEGFEVVRRELLSERAPDGLHPQLLVLRSLPITTGADHIA
jgi:SAM-dependent methyltransferase